VVRSPTSAILTSEVGDALIETAVLGVGLDNTSDKTQDLSLEHESSAEDAPLTDANRRRFARNALVGGTVLLSLGNRSAWAQNVAGPCMSATLWASYTDAGYKFLSQHPGHDTGGWVDYDEFNKCTTAQCAADKMDSRGSSTGFHIDDTGNQVCVVADQPAGSIIAPNSNKMSRQRDRFSKEK
jgi:hypothetical protein